MTIEDMQWSKEVGQTRELTRTLQMHLQGCGEAVRACIMAGRNFESTITQPQLDVPRVDRKARVLNVHT